MTERVTLPMNERMKEFLHSKDWQEILELTKEFNNDPYKMDIIKHVIDQNKQKYLLGRFFHLYLLMRHDGATRQELKRVASYAKVLADARKHFLDEKKAYKELGIFELENKYLWNGKMEVVEREKEF